MKAYPADRRLCVMLYLHHYISRTKQLRGDEKHLFISYVKPHKRVSKQTISRWIKEVMKSAGIDTDNFKPHSTRAAATSAAARCEVPIADILNKAGWKNEKTFQKYYRKPLQTAGHRFDRAVLEGANARKAWTNMIWTMTLMLSVEVLKSECDSLTSPQQI